MFSEPVAERIPKISVLLERKVVTDEEFAKACFAYFVEAPDCDPVAILSRLSQSHCSLVVGYIREFALADFYLPPGEGGCEIWQREYQAECKEVGETILMQFSDG